MDFRLSSHHVSIKTSDLFSDRTNTLLASRVGVPVTRQTVYVSRLPLSPCVSVNRKKCRIRTAYSRRVVSDMSNVSNTCLITTSRRFDGNNSKRFITLLPKYTKRQIKTETVLRHPISERWQGCKCPGAEFCRGTITLRSRAIGRKIRCL